MTSKSIIHKDLHKPNNKLISAWLEHFWCMDKSRASTDSQDSPQPELRGSHHLPPYSILCACPWDQHPNVTLSQDSQVGIPKFPKLGLLQFWRPITLCANLRLSWDLKQICNPCRDLSKDIWHATCTQVNQGNSRLLVVGNQIGNLTPNPSFGHNLCFRFSNGSCKPILDIYVPRTSNDTRNFSI
jgi:hypothetical protein